MQRIEVIRASAPLVVPDDLLTTSLGATMNDWWNHQPADNTLFVVTLGSVTTTALGMAVSMPHRRVIAIESDGGVLFKTERKFIINYNFVNYHGSVSWDFARVLREPNENVEQ